MVTKNKTISLRVSDDDLFYLNFIAKKLKNNNSSVIKKLIAEKAQKMQEEELKNAYLEISGENRKISEDSVLLFNEINNGN